METLDASRLHYGGQAPKDARLWTQGTSGPIPTAPRRPDPPEPARRHLPGEEGMPSGDVNPPADLEPESICGDADDSQRVEAYDGSLGVSKAFVAEHQAPVGCVQWDSDLAQHYADPGNVAGARFCTGTLITDDLFMTAAHCFEQGGRWVFPRDASGQTIRPSEVATNMHVDFNYQHDPEGNVRTGVAHAITELVEFRPDGLDVAVVRLAGRPGRRFGRTLVSAIDARRGEMLCVIQHPSGLPKRVEAGPMTGSGLGGNNDYFQYNSLDTQGGSSGSGVLGTDGLLRGVHTNGGCRGSRPETRGNHGLRIEEIARQSPLVRSLAHVPTTMSSVATPHWLRAEMAGGEAMFTLTGTVVAHLGGTGADWRRTWFWLPIPISGLRFGEGLRIKHWAPKVALAAVGNRNRSVHEGWAVDAFALDFDRNEAVDHINLRTKVAVRDSDGTLLRFNYRIHLIGRITTNS